MLAYDELILLGFMKYIICREGLGIVQKKIFLLFSGLILILLMVNQTYGQIWRKALETYGRGERLEQGGKTTAAVKEFERAVHLAPENLGMRTHLAWMLLNQGRPEEALSHFQVLLSQKPDLKEAIYGLAMAKMRLGKSEEAVRVLDYGLKIYPRDIAFLKFKAAVLTAKPQTAYLALQVYDKLRKLEPQNSEWPRQQQVSAQKAAAYRYDLALALLKEGKRQDALQELKAAIELAPESLGYRTHYGWVLLEMGQLALAAQTFEEVLAEDPKQHEAIRGLSWAQVGLGDAPKALATASRGLSYFPNDEQFLEIMAEAGGARRQTYGLAVEIYQKLLAQRPKDTALLLKFAGVLKAQGQTDKAEEIFKEILAAKPGNNSARLGMARIAMDSLYYGCARADYEKVLASNPENQEAQQGLRQAQEFMRPQMQVFGGYLEDSETFKRSYVYSSFRSYLTKKLIGSLGYGYIVYEKGDGSFGSLIEQEIHRHTLPLQFQFRPHRKLVLEASVAFNNYGSFWNSVSARASAYYQMNPSRGIYFNYSHYDVIDPGGPFNGPWGRHIDPFPEYQRYRYWISDPVSLWAQNIYGSSSTLSIFRHIQADDLGLWVYQELFKGLILSGYGAVGPYTDGNFRKTASLSAAYRLITKPLLFKLKYSFFYLGYRTSSATLQGLPPDSVQLYFDPIAFKNHSWGTILEKNFGDRLKFSLESDIQLTPGAPSPGFLALAEMDVLIAKQLSFRLVGFYNNSVNSANTSYQVRTVIGGLTVRF